jgi:hypothetical protein
MALPLFFFCVLFFFCIAHIIRVMGVIAPACFVVDAPTLSFVASQKRLIVVFYWWWFYCITGIYRRDRTVRNDETVFEIALFIAMGVMPR